MKIKNFNEFLNEAEKIENDVESMRQRVIEHIDRVKYFYNKLVEGNMIPKEEIISDIVEHHDEDKLEYENLRKQALRFIPQDQITPELKVEIDGVVRDHVKTNPHHCEFWGKPNEDHTTFGIHCEAMPDKFIYEMMADWAATAEEKGNPIYNWYDLCVNQKKRWFFNAHQKDVMERCMDYLQQFIDTTKERVYANKIVDPALINK